MRSGLKVFSLIFISLFLCFSVLSIAGDAKGKSLSNEQLKRVKEEREINRAYLSEKLQNMSKEEKLSFLLNLLDDPNTRFPENALREVSLLSIEKVREIAADHNRKMHIRSEALAVLTKLKDQRIIPFIKDDPILMEHTPANGGDIGGEIYRFQENFLELNMVGMNEAERINYLSERLKAGEQISVVVTKLISLYKKAVPELIRIVSNKKNTFLARSKALFTLKQIGDKASAPVALNILKDEEENDTIRGLAAATLGRVGDESTIPVLEHVSRTWKPKEKGPYRVDKHAKQAIEEIRKRSEAKRNKKE